MARRIAVNMTSLLTSDVLNRAASFIVYAMVARYCGSTSFGQLSLGLMLLYTFQVFASAGLPTLITREVAKRHDLSRKYLVNSSIIVLGTAVLSLTGLFVLATISDYPRDTRNVVQTLGLCVLPWSLAMMSEAVLKAWERMVFIVMVAVPVNLLKVVVCFYLLASGRGVESITWVFVASYCLGLVLEWLVLACFLPRGEARVNFGFCRDLLTSTWRFLGIDSVIAVWGSTNILLLSWLTGEAAVGVFSAAWQLLVPMTIIWQAVGNSMFPVLCRRAERGRKRLQQLAVWMLEMQAIVAVPFCILMYFAAGPVIQLVYSHDDFSSSVVALRIMLPMLLLQAVTTTLGQVLYSRRQEHLTLRIVVIDAVFNLVCGVVLVSFFGVVGAATTVLLTWTLNAYLHYAATREALADDDGIRVRWHSTLFAHVLVAGCAMSAVMAVTTSLNIVVASVLTICLYLALLAALVWAACKSGLGLRERFLMPLSEQ